MTNPDVHMQPVRRIVLCADDYGQSQAINAGILALLDQQRLSAVSCLSEAKSWCSPDNRLVDYRGQIDIGLHFNLTEPLAAAAVPARPLNAVLRSALLGRIDSTQVETALHAQLDAFEAVLGQAPDFVDGHQHVHILPGVRSPLLRVLAQRYGTEKPYLRTVNPRFGQSDNPLKTAFLKLLDSGFRAAAVRHGFASNPCFAGVYSLRPGADFPALMQDWLHSAHDGELLMCHPGHMVCDPSDAIAATRPRELVYLGSARFAALLARERIELVRFGALHACGSASAQSA